VPTYDYQCPEGHVETKRFDSYSHAPKHMRCSICRRRSNRQFPLDVQMQTFDPYYSHAMDSRPVWIGSRRDRERELARRGLQIKG